MSAFQRLFRLLAVSSAAITLLGADVAAAQAPMDPANPTCPRNPNWSGIRQMRFTVQEVDGRQVLLAEGQIDDDLMPRLQEALRTFDGEEIWLRSPGGNYQVSYEAGRLIRENGFATHIPSGSACFAACNFLFMGGVVRTVDPGGYYIVDKFTGSTRLNAIAPGAEGRDLLVAEVERQAAQMATVEHNFLLRMGVSTRLLTDIVYRGSAAARRCLTRDELVEYRVVGPPQPVRSR